MHEHTAKYGVPVRGVRDQAPCGPKADLQNVIGYRSNGQPVYVMAGASPLATESELADLRKEITRLEGEASVKREAADELVADMRESGTDPLQDKDAFTKVDEAYKESDTLLQEAAELRMRADRAMETMSKTPPRKTSRNGDDPAVSIPRRLSQNFIDSDVYARVRDLIKLDLRAAASHLRDNPTEVLSRDELEVMLREVIVPGSPSPLIPPDYRPPVLGLVRPTKILDLITVGQTDSDLVQYVIEVLHPTAAAETVFGDPATPGTGLLPESDFEFVPADTGVKRIGHWTPVRESTLADASQLRTVLQTRLREGAQRRTEDQVIAGDGLGENITGILETTGIGSVTHQDIGPPDYSTENVLDTIHRGITSCRLAEVEPNGVAIHPVDFEQGVVLLKDDVGNYLFKIGEPASVWGKPAAVTTSVPEDTAVVGAFEHAVLLLRTALQILASTEHEDFFLRGLVALKAEYRAAFYVDRPAAFCAVEGI